jgi:hypothetical protein
LLSHVAITLAGARLEAVLAAAQHENLSVLTLGT